MGVKHSTNNASRIKRELENSSRLKKKTAKILLLGAGDTGKTTVYKQLVLSRGNGLSEVEVQKDRDGILSNIVTGTTLLAEEVDWSDEVIETAKIVAETVFDEKIKLTKPYVDAALVLWGAISEQEKLEFFRCHNVSDNLMRLIENLARFPNWGGEEWTPSNEDCLMSRIMTTGVNNVEFQSGGRNFTVIDVGGQRGERRRWLGLFASMSAVIYIISLSDYDQTLFEDTKMNRLKEQVALFRSTIKSQQKIFSKLTFIRFFNKVDLFREKYFELKIPLSVSGIEGGPLVEDNPTEDEVIEWFKAVLSEEIEEIPIRYFDHVTCALDGQTMRTVIRNCEETVLRVLLNPLQTL